MVRVMMITFNDLGRLSYRVMSFCIMSFEVCVILVANYLGKKANNSYISGVIDSSYPRGKAFGQV
jgi:hypothetical protein